MTAALSPSSALDVLAELAAIRDYVLKAQDLMRAGKMPDMRGLEERTAALCEIIQKASSDLQKKCAPELVELVHQLDDCEKDLHAFCNEAAESTK